MTVETTVEHWVVPSAILWADQMVGKKVGTTAACWAENLVDQSAAYLAVPMVVN